MRLPIPRIEAHILEIFLRFPAQNALSLVGVGVTFGDIARTARLDNVGDLEIVDLFKRFYDVEHAVAGAGAEVDDLNALVSAGILDRLDVTLGEVDHMDIVAHAGTVMGRIIISENIQMIALSDCNLCDIREKIDIQKLNAELKENKYI